MGAPKLVFSLPSFSPRLLKNTQCHIRHYITVKTSPITSTGTKFQGNKVLVFTWWCFAVKVKPPLHSPIDGGVRQALSEKGVITYVLSAVSTFSGLCLPRVSRRTFGWIRAVHTALLTSLLLMQQLALRWSGLHAFACFRQYELIVLILKSCRRTFGVVRTRFHIAHKYAADAAVADWGFHFCRLLKLAPSPPPLVLL